VLKGERLCIGFPAGHLQTILRGKQSELVGATAHVQQSASRSEMEALVKISCTALDVTREAIGVTVHPAIFEASLHTLHFGRYRTGKHGFLYCVFKSKNCSALPLHRSVAL
jgi:hypothetical protein